MLIAVALLASLHFLHLFPLIKSEVFSCWERLIAHHCGGRVVQSEGGVFSNRLPRCADTDQSADYLHINGQESKEAPVGVSARWLANYQMEAWCNSSRDDFFFFNVPSWNLQMFFVQQICYVWAILYKFNPENINLDEKCGDIIKENLYLVNLVCKYSNWKKTTT